jgi:hypothetical protein
MDDLQLTEWLRTEHAIHAVRARIIRKRNGWSKGHAAVALDSRADADAATASLDNIVGPNPTKRMIARIWEGVVEGEATSAIACSVVAHAPAGAERGGGADNVRRADAPAR